MQKKIMMEYEPVGNSIVCWIDGFEKDDFILVPYRKNDVKGCQYEALGKLIAHNRDKFGLEILVNYHDHWTEL